MKQHGVLASQLLQLAALVLLYALDARDLGSKLIWLGPPDNFAFNARSSSAIDAEPLALVSNANSSLVVGDVYPDGFAATSWHSFYSNCEQIYAGDKVFDTFVGTNCRLGTFGSFFTAPALVFSASVRVDSVAWASCKMLLLHRRPPLCHEPIVANFSRRYHVQDLDVRLSYIAAMNSDAEFELLRMLDMLGRAQPLTQVVCTEGFQYGGPGQYSPSLFTCASPNVFESVIAGFHATALARVHDGLSWLAVDTVRLFGFDFVVRQNSRSAFFLESPEMPTTITTLSTVNFSSFGHLYVLMLVVDALLLVVHVGSCLETAFVLGVPVLGSSSHSESVGLQPGFSWTLLYRSLFRSKPVAVLTVLSGVLSWITMLPNAAISGWDVDAGGRSHAFFTSVRVWMLVTALLTLSWDAAVVISEARAYRIARATYVSLLEVLVIVASVCVFERADVFDIAMKKHKLEAQRSWSTGVFVGQVAFANAYNEAQDVAVSTRADSLSAIYDPLVAIVWKSLFLIGILLGARFTYVGYRERKHFEADEACRIAAEIEVIESTDDLDLSPRPLVVTTRKYEYARLPLEDRLQLPIRASSLVRNSMELEQVIADEQYINPPVYFDAGLVVKDGLIRTRWGFRDLIHAKPDKNNAATVMPAADALEDSSSGSPSKSSIASAKATAVANLVLATDVPGVGVGVGGSASANGVAADTSGGAPGRRPLAETANAAAARSMRRRKSINEFTSVPL